MKEPSYTLTISTNTGYSKTYVNIDGFTAARILINNIGNLKQFGNYVGRQILKHPSVIQSLKDAYINFVMNRYSKNNWKPWSKDYRSWQRKHGPSNSLLDRFGTMKSALLNPVTTIDSDSDDHRKLSITPALPTNKGYPYFLAHQRPGLKDATSTMWMHPMVFARQSFLRGNRRITVYYTNRHLIGLPIRKIVPESVDEMPEFVNSLTAFVNSAEMNSEIKPWFSKYMKEREI